MWMLRAEKLIEDRVRFLMDASDDFFMGIGRSPI